MVRVPPLVDMAAAAALVAAGAFEIATGNVEGADPRVIFASLLVGGIALLVRSRWPLVCLGLLVMPSDPHRAGSVGFAGGGDAVRVRHGGAAML